MPIDWTDERSRYRDVTVPTALVNQAIVKGVAQAPGRSYRPLVLEAIAALTMLTTGGVLLTQPARTNPDSSSQPRHQNQATQADDAEKQVGQGASTTSKVSVSPTSFSQLLAMGDLTVRGRVTKLEPYVAPTSDHPITFTWVTLQVEQVLAGRDARVGKPLRVLVSGVSSLPMNQSLALVLAKAPTGSNGIKTPYRMPVLGHAGIFIQQADGQYRRAELPDSAGGGAGGPVTDDTDEMMNQGMNALIQQNP